MWPCVANVSEICCFQLARGLREASACPTTTVMCSRHSRFTSWALGSNHPVTPAWVLGHQTGHSVRLWVLHALLPACPGLRKPAPSHVCFQTHGCFVPKHCSGNCAPHPAPSPKNVTLIQVSLPLLGNSQRKGPNWTGEATGSRTRLILRREDEEGMCAIET